MTAYQFLVSPPSASLSPGGLSFGNQALQSTSAPQVETLSNNGAGPLNITGIAATGDYRVTSNNCPASLQAGTNCTFNVTFTPTVVGTDNGTLTVTDNSFYGSTQMFNLTGTGVAPVTVSPTSLNFGNQPILITSKPMTVKLTNNQSTALAITSIVASAGFTETNTCGGTVAALGTCTISVTSTPTATGAYTGSITITDNAITSPQTVSLAGTGVEPVTLSPTSLTFATQPILIPSAPMTVTLTNNNPASALAITSIVASAGFTETNTCGGTVAALGTCTISVTSTPTATGAYTGSITVTDNATNSPQTVSLAGTGIAQATAAPKSLDFPAQTVGTKSAAKAVTLTNNLSTALTFTVTFAGADHGDFTATNGCGGTVAAGSHCTIDVRFTPRATGTRTAELEINDSAAGAPQKVSLKGTGQ